MTLSILFQIRKTNLCISFSLRQAQILGGVLETITYTHHSRRRGGGVGAITTADLSWQKDTVDLCGAVIHYWSFVCEWHVLTVLVSPPALRSPPSRRARAQHEVRFWGKGAAYKQKSQLLGTVSWSTMGSLWLKRFSGWKAGKVALGITCMSALCSFFYANYQRGL